MTSVAIAISLLFILFGLLLLLLLFVLLFLLLRLFLGGGGSCLRGKVEFRCDCGDARGLVLDVTEQHLPGLGRFVNDAPKLVQFALSLQLRFLNGKRTEFPLLVVSVSVQDDTLRAADLAVVAGGDGARSHDSDGQGNSLTLRGDEDDLLLNLDVGLVTQDARKHELRAIADGVDGGVFDDDTRVASEEDLEGHDDTTQVVLLAVVLVVPLGVLDVVKGDHGAVFLQRATAVAAKLLHVGAAADEIADVDAHGTDVSSSLAADPEDAEVTLLVVLDELRLVDRPHTELLLDGRDEWGTLEAGTSEGLESLLHLLLGLIDLGMQLDDGDVLLTSGLLGLHKSGRIADAGDEAASDLGVKRAGVAGLFDLEDFLDPRDNLVTGGVARLVEIDDAILLEKLNRTLQGGVTARQRCEVVGLHVQLVIILEKERPIGSVQGGGRLRWFQRVFFLILCGLAHILK